MNIPTMTPVESSNLKSVRYDGQNLFVEFGKGSIYVYYEVPLELYTELLKAESKGKYLNSNIKNVYRYEKIR